MPFFSVIIPVYKIEQYLEKCVYSVLVQTFDDFEIILVDDGSPDRCPSICDSFHRVDNRVKVFHKINGGLSDARNFGIENATGEYVLLLDGDDYWDNPNALSEAFVMLNNDKADILIFGKKKYFQITNKISDSVKPAWKSDSNKSIRYLMENNYFVACAWDKIIRKEYITRNNLRFVVGQLSEDIEWCANLLIHNPTFELLEMDFYVYRQQNNLSITSNIGKKNLNDICDVICRFAQNEMLETECGLQVKNFMAVEYVLWLAITKKVSNHEIKNQLSIMKTLWFLLDYNWYPYVKKVNKVRLLGFDGLRYLLGAYLTLKGG